MWKLCNRTGKFPGKEQICPGYRQMPDLFSTLWKWVEVNVDWGIVPVFHLSSLPTVTAGYDGFAFDIREYSK